MKTPEIILPKRIAVLREQPHQDIKVKNEEFSLYFANFIHPIYPWHDIVVECEYGKNLGHCWRINDYPADVKEFGLSIKIYDEEGCLVTEKKTVVELCDQDIDAPFRVLCIGDSMTHHMIYVSHMQNRLKNVFTCGTRSYDGHVFGEGRGGWSYDLYLNKHSLEKGERGATKWVSPFLFPKGISGTEYFGDMEFYEASQEKNRSSCCFNGFVFSPIKEGQYYHKHGKLYKQGEEKPVSDHVEWELSFKKYLERNNIKNPDAVSLLFGANDLWPYSYENPSESIDAYINNMKKFIASIKEADKNIDVIINLPIPGSDQSGFGKVMGCNGTYKAYNYKIREGAKAILSEFEGADGIHICPMLHAIDTQHGFDNTSIRANLYDDTQLVTKDDAVHPNSNGYRQMGDALAAAVEMLRHKSLKSVGAGVAGGVSNDILDTTNLPFTGYNLKAELVKYMEGFTEVENDANCAAIAETKYGNVSDCKNLVLMTLGTGVGGGVVLDEKIFRGHTGCGGEIGHMIVQTIGGRKCPCGQTGCLEQYASASALVRSAKSACRENPDSFLYKQYVKKEEQFSGKDIFIALENECNIAKKIFDEYLCYLAAGVDSVVNAFNPEAVVLAGGITVQGEKLLNPLKEKLCSKIRIEISELQGDAGALGATML